MVLPFSQLFIRSSLKFHFFVLFRSFFVRTFNSRNCWTFILTSYYSCFTREVHNFFSTYFCKNAAKLRRYYTQTSSVYYRKTTSSNFCICQISRVAQFSPVYDVLHIGGKMSVTLLHDWLIQTTQSGDSMLTGTICS